MRRNFNTRVLEVMFWAWIWGGLVWGVDILGKDLGMDKSPASLLGICLGSCLFSLAFTMFRMDISEKESGLRKLLRSIDNKINKWRKEVT